MSCIYVQRSLVAGTVAQLRGAVSRVEKHYPCYFIKYQEKHFQFRPQNTQVTMTIICYSLPAGEVSRWRNTIKTRRKTEIMFNSDAAWILSVHFIVEYHTLLSPL